MNSINPVSVKDYGFDTIDEVKTPFHEYQEPEDDSLPKQSSLEISRGVSNSAPVDAALLSKLLTEKGGQPPKTTTNRGGEGSGKGEAEKKEFEAQRKSHYDEFQTVKKSQISSPDKKTTSKDGRK